MIPLFHLYSPFKFSFWNLIYFWFIYSEVMLLSAKLSHHTGYRSTACWRDLWTGSKRKFFAGHRSGQRCELPAIDGWREPEIEKKKNVPTWVFDPVNGSNGVLLCATHSLIHSLYITPGIMPQISLASRRLGLPALWVLNGEEDTPRHAKNGRLKFWDVKGIPITVYSAHRA